ncbi:OmpA family protein [Mitsuaria sp. GD03876]|uniref:OmpA family protein n=1 Tax=Mitsuaria sp. GD03876 TaxID=2975399 RepID=UPI00244A0D04|nr:OmpA family protein [Mitsuaria sp. GD03876]MDH0867693.1 OmpA family protein [Mitsuaria sp. GD03876]
MRRPRVFAAPASADLDRRWRRLAAASLPVLAIALLLTLGGCATQGGRAGTAASPSNTAPGSLPGAAPDVVAGNRWSSWMDERRDAITRAGAGTGIAVARTTDNQLKLTVPTDATFETGRADLRQALRPVLDEVSRGLDDSVRVTIVGHTDSAAGDAVNGPLSQDRAESVREYLVQHGVRRGRVLVEGRGGRQPVASNATEPGRAANRRIEIFLSQPAS